MCVMGDMTKFTVRFVYRDKLVPFSIAVHSPGPTEWLCAPWFGAIKLIATDDADQDAIIDFTNMRYVFNRQCATKWYYFMTEFNCIIIMTQTKFCDTYG